MIKMRIIMLVLAILFIAGAVVSALFKQPVLMTGNLLISIMWGVFYRLFSSADKIEGL